MKPDFGADIKQPPAEGGVLEGIVVLIPAYNPGRELERLVDELRAIGLGRIVVVDDGSDQEHAGIFCRIEERATVLRHAVNLGKGAALKTGFNHIYTLLSDVVGVVTADADGQHAAGDVAKVASRLASDPMKVVLGSRRFTGQVPWRSLVGNLATRYLFRLLVGRTISDTQTGLRGLPRSLLPSLLSIEGRGYEYEMSMLIALRRLPYGLAEVEIDTIYQTGNAGSHFNPLLDSMRIYLTLFRFSLSSLLASLIDLAVFYSTFKLTENLLLSMLLGRYTIGPLVNFYINRNFVFHSRAGYLIALLKYFLVATILGLLATALVSYAVGSMGFGVLLAKVVVETVLFFASFTVQRDFIFGRQEAEC